MMYLALWHHEARLHSNGLVYFDVHYLSGTLTYSVLQCSVCIIANTIPTGITEVITALHINLHLCSSGERNGTKRGQDKATM